MKTKTTIFSLVTLLSLAFNASSEELSEKKLTSVKRDLNIMTTIIKTAINNNEHGGTKVEGTYLANQGMVFTVGDSRNFRFHFSDMHDHIAPPAPPLPVMPSLSAKAPLTEEHIEIIEESTMEAVEVAMDMAEIQMEFYSDTDWSNHSTRERSESRAQQRELQNQRRELERESRNLERSVREMERKIRDAEYQQELNNTKENQKKVAELEQEMSELMTSLSGVAKKINEKATALKAKANEIRQKQVEKLQAEIKATETVISQAVCDFGGGLRSLSKGEHITFNLKGKTNRIYVFDLPTINQCADGDINAETLLAKATQYSL